MKLTILEQPDGEPELIVKCKRTDDPEIQALLKLLSCRAQQIPARGEDGAVVLLEPGELLYCEYVDTGVFAYTKDAVLPTPLSLSSLEQRLREAGFFRCSKAMVVNLHALRALKSTMGGRILATLQNGEQILISRHYAASLRQRLGL